MKVQKDRKMNTVVMGTALLCAIVCFTGAFPGTAGAFLERPDDVIEGSCGDNNTEGKSILIAYDTKHGSTAEVVEKIAEVLCRDGFQVDYMMARNVDNVSAYDAVVVGSPVYNFFWLPGATLFLRKHENVLAEKQIFYFITCTYLKDENDTRERREHAVELYVQPIIDRFGIEPESSGILSGEFEYAELYPYELISMLLAGFEEGDFRNWDKITGWAEEVGTLID